MIPNDPIILLRLLNTNRLKRNFSQSDINIQMQETSLFKRIKENILFYLTIALYCDILL